MPIIGTNWFKSGRITCVAQGANTITHGLGFTPDIALLQYVNGGTPNPSMPLELNPTLYDRTFWSFTQSQAANAFTIEAYVARLHTIVS